jgi:UDP-N-acetylglucosamine 2-epimerase
MIKLVTVIGARPQFIKAAAVRRAIQAFNSGRFSGHNMKPNKKIREILVHTGQHYDYLMDKVFFEELQLPHPDHHLGVGSGSHARQTGIMLERIEAVLQEEKPQGVLVYGDTNSTLAGALTAAKLHIPVAHVEAGLRSYQRTMPEEINRLLTDHLSTLLFCPTASAVNNLEREGIKDGKEKAVKKVGDVMYDSILYYSKIAEGKSTILKELGLFRSDTRHSAPITSHYYLATLHRAENTDNPERLRSLLKALSVIGKKSPVILPLHPRTNKMMRIHRLLPKSRGVKLIDPVSYFDMLTLEKNAKVILTDSGGVQKEAYWLNVPCLTLREETEWGEIVDMGWNRLVGFETKKILEGIHHFEKTDRANRRPWIFGDGKAGSKIVRLLVKHLA